MTNDHRPLAAVVRERLTAWAPGADDFRLGFVASTAVHPPRGVVFVFCANRAHLLLTLKVALSEEGVRALEHEYEMVRAVNALHRASTFVVPEAIDQFGHGSGAVGVFSGLPGAQFPSMSASGWAGPLTARSVSRFVDIASDVSRSLAALAPSSTEVGWSEILNRAIDAVGVAADRRQPIDRLVRHLESVGATSPVALQHGDLTSGNLLLDDGSIGVVDWEKAGWDYPCWYDLIYGVLSLAFSRRESRPTRTLMTNAFAGDRAAGRAARAACERHWSEPMPIGDAAVVTALIAAQRSVELGRSGADRWIDIAITLLSDAEFRHRAAWLAPTHQTAGAR